MTWTTLMFLKLVGAFTLIFIAVFALEKFLDAVSNSKGQRHD